MADVTMPLSELDKMRDDVKSKEVKIKELEKTLVDVETDKRVVKIVRTVTKAAPIRIDPADAYKFMKEQFDLQTSRARNTHSFARSSYEVIGNEIARGIEDLVKRSYVVQYDYTDPVLAYKMGHSTSRQVSFYKEKISEDKQYVNFEDVQQELRQEVERSVNEELGTLRSQVDQHTQLMAEMKADHLNKIRTLNKTHKDEVELLDEGYRSQIDSLEKQITEAEKKYIDLKEDRDTRSTEQKLIDQIKELEEKLAEALKPKPSILKKFFGTP